MSNMAMYDVGASSFTGVTLHELIPGAVLETCFAAAISKLSGISTPSAIISYRAGSYVGTAVAITSIATIPVFAGPVIEKIHPSLIITGSLCLLGAGAIGAHRAGQATAECVTDTDVTFVEILKISAIYTICLLALKGLQSGA